ncbi:AAA family ATPase [Demequina mangrovi]|uniref:Mrr N-terminal domain-containing protein n=1 Tax=Demequina mangrovi TaxID=1043493 RepID=A0A1H6ZDH1_9MICO|nr:AAA family ATPase [Demequina mangrovi]SEJ51613.1 Mrr N-terminal domain-containing protein [Demequina mangrovi]
MSDDDTLRYDVYAHAMLRALVDLGGTAPKSEVIARVAHYVEPNERESSKLKSGRVRWANMVAWLSTDFKAARWIVKPTFGQWSITDAGRHALETMTPSELQTTAARLYREERRRLEEQDISIMDDEEDEDTTAATPRSSSIPPTDDALVGATTMPRASLSEYLSLLASRKQIVLYGPPGTGKTFIAQQLASHIVGELKAAYTIVQFHPSYAYEDFFEGFRPVVRDGVASYELRHGPLRKIAAEAENNPGQPYVLVIDEINRANIAKVFGELYYLLEYRDEQITLQYQTAEQFSLPPNVYIIATMNTVDRSIALVDAAIRRRFSFIELHPSEEPVAGVLERKGHADLSRLLTRLNSLIGEQRRDLQIGPSYLMRPEARTSDGLERIWRYDILPLLEEQFLGDLSREEVHRRFALARLVSTTPDS